MDATYWGERFLISGNLREQGGVERNWENRDSNFLDTENAASSLRIVDRQCFPHQFASNASRAVFLKSILRWIRIMWDVLWGLAPAACEPQQTFHQVLNDSIVCDVDASLWQVGGNIQQLVHFKSW